MKPDKKPSETKRAPRSSTRPSALTLINLCSCQGCRQHVARLEELNAQLARENDRLHRELREGKRAA